MTKPMTIALAVVVSMSSFALAQERGKPDTQTWAASTKALTVSGKVSDDGKRFITDIDTEWTINNPESLKSHEGHLVTIKCYVDSDKDRIQVLSVKSPQYAAMHSDSAFRR